MRKGPRGSTSHSKPISQLDLQGFPHISDMLRGAPLVFLAFGGYIKGSRYLSWAPLDPTLLAAAIVFLQVLFSLTQKKTHSSRVVWVTVLLASFWVNVPSLRLDENTYATTKLGQVYAIIPLCLIGAMTLLRTPAQRKSFLANVVALGFLALLLARLDPSTISNERLAIAGGNTIGLGRGAGAAVVVCVLLAFSYNRWRIPLLTLALIALTAALLAASRGPLLASAFSIALSGAVVRNPGRFRRLLISAGAIGAVSYWVLVSGNFDQRLTETGDASSLVRKTLWDRTAHIIPSHPSGIGWGRLFDELQYAYLDSGYVQYPHNVLLEITSEAGWVAGAAFLFVTILAIWDQCRAATHKRWESAMLGLLLYAAINALVSGDVGANRGLWVAIGAAFAATCTERSTSAASRYPAATLRERSSQGRQPPRGTGARRTATRR